jgi:hypothetical protein
MITSPLQPRQNQNPRTRLNQKSFLKQSWLPTKSTMLILILQFQTQIEKTETPTGIQIFKLDFGFGFGSCGAQVGLGGDGGQADESENKQLTTAGQTQQSPQLSPGPVINEITSPITPHNSTDHLPTSNPTDLFQDHPDEAIHSGMSLAQAGMA